MGVVGSPAGLSLIYESGGYSLRNDGFLSEARKEKNIFKNR